MTTQLAWEATECVERAEALLAARELDAAEAAFHSAIAGGADPDRCSAGRWMVQMLRGQYEAAWRESDAIRARGGEDPHRFWLGEDVRDRRVMVRSLHGFGDAVQMLRFAPQLRELAASVVWEVAPDLLELAHCFAGVDEVVTWGDRAPTQAPEWDVQVEVMELPHLFRTTLAQLPVATKYVHLPEQICQSAASAMRDSGRLRAGLCSAASTWDERRTLPPMELNELVSEDQVEWWCMDRTGGLRGDPRLRNLRDECGDGLMMLAAAIANLDLVITVDTLAAHLSGALGKPTLVLLQHGADWRWMVKRHDSPWYPTMRLYRQSSPGAWHDVVAQVSRDLKAWTAQHGRMTA
jgi:hypothetical protein